MHLITTYFRYVVKINTRGKNDGRIVPSFDGLITILIDWEENSASVGW